MSMKVKALIGVAVYLVIFVLLLLILGNEGKNEAFQPQNEFKLDPWVTIDIAGIDFSINKAVFYLVLASVLTITAMTFVASRMQREPNKIQMAVELAYDLTRDNITGGNIPDERLARRWFPVLAGLFFFIWFSNMIESAAPRSTPSTRSTCSASRFRHSPSTRRPRTSRSRSCSHWSCGSPTTGRGSGRRAFSTT